MEAVYSASVPYIHNLQLALSPYESLLTMISTVLDPRYAFYIYTPLLYALEPKSGRQLLWVSVLAEWSNQILKWLLHGHRPYWYVHVAPDSATLPSLIQYPVSCETGPGSPSGHAMVTAAVFFVLIAFMLDSGKTNRRLRYVAWTGFVALIALVSISRVFLAAHFPHQCALGAVLGLVVVIAVRRMSPWLDQLTRNQYLLATAFLGGTALITRQLLPLLGMDGEWSVRLATQHCIRPEWVHLDTSPLFSLMRYTGFLAGFGLGLHSSTARQFNRLHFNTRMRLATAMVSLTLAKCSELIPKPPSSQLYMLYAYGFILSAGLAFIYTALSPLLVVKCTPKLVYRKTSTIDNC